MSLGAKTQGDTFEAVVRTSPTQHVQKQLIQAIRSGELSPDKPFPSEKELCETFGVSRVSIREALAGLVATGLIEIQQGKRATVRPNVDHAYAGLFALYIDINKEGLTELLEIRSALDGLAASKAAMHKTDASMKKIVDAHEAFQAAVENNASPEELRELDIRFHAVIAEAGGGELLQAHLKQLSELFIGSREILFTRPGQLPRSIAGHQQIVDGILAGDVEGVRQAASDHVVKRWSWVEHFKSYHPNT
ncbi:MAG: FadR/GntR family transcriptional regulator [Microbacteriaceae bacterium]